MQHVASVDCNSAVKQEKHPRHCEEIKYVICCNYREDTSHTREDMPCVCTCKGIYNNDNNYDMLQYIQVQVHIVALD